MPRLRLDLAYVGDRFSGWQAQAGRRTVQGELARVLAAVGEAQTPMGAGRTDSGVHALRTTAHCDTERVWAPDELRRALVGRLPEDIELLRVSTVDATFHARFDAELRTYHYAVGLSHNAFFRTRRWCPREFPTPAEAEAELSSLHGQHDFSSYRKSGSDAGTALCTVERTAWTPFPGGAVVTLAADRFLYGMVRTVLGALVRGREPGRLARILAQRDRAAAGPPAPPEGLYLAQVQYPGDPDAFPEPGITADLAGLGNPLTRETMA